MGHVVAQATLSRRLKKLRIFKISGRYSIPNDASADVPTILDMKVSDFGLIVLRTLPGGASGLAYSIDQKYIFNVAGNGKNVPILGTIAGDDTVLVLVRRKDDVECVLSALRSEFFPSQRIPRRNVSSSTLGRQKV
jgi:transcriptional regulator of arginine metabolism